MRHPERKDPRGAHARIYTSIVNSPIWPALSFSAISLYVQLRVRLNGHNNGDISATLSTLKHSGFTTSSTLAKALRELETVGLIDRTRQGSIAGGGRTCNLFRFTDEATYDVPKKGVKATPATKDWEKWKSVREVKAAIKAAHANVKRPVAENNVKVRDLHQTDSDCEVATKKTASHSRTHTPCVSPKTEPTACCLTWCKSLSCLEIFVIHRLHRSFQQ